MAVAPGVLLASCGAVGGRERVGLVRHAKYRMAAVEGADPGRDVCVLRAADAPLTPIGARRDLAGVEPGEAVFAIPGDLRVVAGRVTARRAGADPALEATLDLPAGDLGVVVVDRRGALVGLGTADGARPGSATIRPVGAALASLRPEGGADLLARGVVPGEGPGDEPPAIPGLALATRAGEQRPVLAAGERLELALRPEGDGFAYCFYADAAGRVSRILPNRFAPDPRVAAGGEVAIPGPAARFEIVPERPGAVEEVACLATPVDLAASLPGLLAGPDLAPLPVASLDAAVVAFRAAAGAAPVAEARLSVTVAAERQVAARLDPAAGP